MPRRKKEEANDVQVIFRTTDELKKKIDAAADAEGLSTADWLRNLVIREFNNNPSTLVMPRDLGEVGQIRAELDRKLEDELRRYEEQERRLRELEEKLYEKTQLDEAAAELKERMAALEQQLDELTKPNITQNAGRDAKIQVGR